MRTKGDMITAISHSGDRYGSALNEFCIRYSLMGLMDASEEQLREFIEEKGIEDYDEQDKDRVVRLHVEPDNRMPPRVPVLLRREAGEAVLR